MAKSSDTSSVFRIVATATALSLMVAAAMFFFQAGSGSSGAELAALSPPDLRVYDALLQGVTG